MKKDTHNKQSLNSDELKSVSGGCLEHKDEPRICNKPWQHPVMPLYGIPNPGREVWTDKPPKEPPKEIEESYGDVLAPILKNPNRNEESK